MKFYIATSFTAHERHNRLRDALIARLGHEISYDWTKHHEDNLASNRRKCAEADVNGVRDADYVIVLLPGGRGTHAELGMALALNKPTLIVSQDASVFEPIESNHVFYFHPMVARVTVPETCQKFFDFLQGWEKKFHERVERHKRFNDNFGKAIAGVGASNYTEEN